jgi:hypothetical protein
VDPDLDADADADPAIFIIDLQDTSIKIIYILLFERTFPSFFKDKKSKRSHKTVEIKVFLLFFLNDRRIRIRIRNTGAKV